jgi:PadR family transcriptional regulator AphA
MTNLNPTSYAILGLLSVGDDLSGYDMRKAIHNSIGYFWGESYGQLYPALKKLSGAELIAPQKGGAKGRKRRQTYRLTATGRAALREWLGVPFENDPPRNEFMLKLFFAYQAAPGVAESHLRDLNERNRHMIKALEKIKASVPAGHANPNMPYWMLVLGLGEAMTRAALKWGDAALKTLESGKSFAANSVSKGGTASGRLKSSSRKQVTRERKPARS